MNEKTKKLIEMDKSYIWHPFTQMQGWLETEPVIIESGEGFYLVDTEGRKYIDGVSSLWCNVHGHRVAAIDNAVREQLDKISHSTLLGLGQTKSIELAEKLIAAAPKNLKKVFYSDSGATSVEIALKIAYQYFKNKGIKGRSRFIALENSYHGDTVGSVSVGGIGLFHSIFRPLLFETHFVPTPFAYRFKGTEQECLQYSAGKIEEILKSHGDEIAAVVMEPLVQGAAGMIVHPKGFLKAVRELTRKYGVLLIADEVATGFGRTGRMFACEHEQVEPDILCMAKGISGGYMPLAATLTTGEIFDAFLGSAAEHKTFYHGHTYTGNALACAAGIASLELFKTNRVLESMPEKIELTRGYLAEMARCEYVGDVRQCGVMAGVEIVKDKTTKESFPYELALGAKVCAAMRARGAMMRPLGDVIVLMPPVGMDAGTLKLLLDIVLDTIKKDLPVLAKS